MVAIDINNGEFLKTNGSGTLSFGSISSSFTLAADAGSNDTFTTGGTQYSVGVTTNGTPGSSGAYTQIAVDSETPNILYYQCSSHGFMGNHATNIGNKINSNLSTMGDLTVGTLFKMPDNTSGKILVGDGASYQEVAVSGDATIASNGALTVTGGVSAGFVVAMSIAL